MKIVTGLAGVLAIVLSAPTAFAAPKKPVAATATSTTAPAAKNIVQTAESAGTFTTLVAAVKAAGLAETLQGKGPFTVFAPTDEAFSKLPPGTVENLLKPENVAQLRAILLLHVVSGKVESSALANKTTSVASAQGEKLSIVGTDGVTVNGAKVLTPDIATSNGVIHAIDTVLLPASAAAGPAPAAAAPAPTPMPAPTS